MEYLANLEFMVDNYEQADWELSISEEWRDIEGFEGRYQVSYNGDIRNAAGQVLKGNNAGGYLMVNLYKDGKRTRTSIHRVVAKAFIPNPENKPTVNHIDGNKLKNAVYNLEWATLAEQMKHANETGLIDSNHPFKMKSVVCVNTGEQFDSIAAAHRATGACRVGIGKAIRGLQLSAGMDQNGNKLYWESV